MPDFYCTYVKVICKCEEYNLLLSSLLLFLISGVFTTFIHCLYLWGGDRHKILSINSHNFWSQCSVWVRDITRIIHCGNWLTKPVAIKCTLQIWNWRRLKLQLSGQPQLPVTSSLTVEVLRSTSSTKNWASLKSTSLVSSCTRQQWLKMGWSKYREIAGGKIQLRLLWFQESA